MTEYTKEQIEEVLKLDEKRTQGEWEYKDGTIHAGEDIFAASYCGVCGGKPVDYQYAASAPKMAAIIRQLLAENEELEANLLCTWTELKAYQEEEKARGLFPETFALLDELPQQPEGE